MSRDQRFRARRKGAGCLVGAVLTVLLLGLPAMGILLSGRSLSPYLEFPPGVPFVKHASFSWTAFAVYGFLFAAMAGFVLFLWARSRINPSTVDFDRRRFPWWGWSAVGVGVAAWILAWSRFAWFAPFQPYTFAPLWLSYIVTVNALTFRRTGNCLLCDRPARFLSLFPISACFWWFFEYLNRFVQNWHYVGVEFDAGSYFVHATCSFSTVLPAVLSTRAWLLTFPPLGKAFHGVFPIRPSLPRLLAWLVLCVASAVLFGIGLRPDFLFAGLWVAPLLVLAALQALSGGRHPFQRISEGDWRMVVSSALAALVCGFFWEMWNMWSLAKWQYSVPFVDRFHLFEMPVLGYAGYLPFGLECAAVADWVIHGGKAAPGRPAAP